MAVKRHNYQCAENGQEIYNPLAKRLYTLKEAAQYLGRSDWSMRELIWAGEIPIVRGNGNRKMFLDIKDLEEYIKRNKSIYQ
jgi:excisionase family DNA binding protein